LSQNSLACFIDLKLPQAGCGIPILSRRKANLSLSSALSMESALVPITFTPFLSSSMARSFGVWPPTQRTAPIGFSLSYIESTRSAVSSSK
jgi:hypothetical protein